MTKKIASDFLNPQEVKVNSILFHTQFFHINMDNIIGVGGWCYKHK